MTGLLADQFSGLDVEHADEAVTRGGEDVQAAVREFGVVDGRWRVVES